MEQKIENGFPVIGDALSQEELSKLVLAPDPVTPPEAAQPAVEPKKSFDNKALIGFVTGSNTISLSADPNGTDQYITVVHGPRNSWGERDRRGRWVSYDLATCPQGMYDDIWNNPITEVMTLFMGCVYNDKDQKTRKHNGIQVAKPMEPVRKYEHICACGNRDVIHDSINKGRKKKNWYHKETGRRSDDLICSNAKCRKPFDSKAEFKDFDTMVASRMAVRANGDQIRLFQLPGSDIVEIQEGAYGGVKSRPASEILVKDGDKPRKGQALTAGFTEVTKQLRFTEWARKNPLAVLEAAPAAGAFKEGDPTPDDVILAKFRMEMDMMRAGNALITQEEILPDLVGLFDVGKAPGHYELATQNEVELVSRHAAINEPVELRPYRYIRGMQNLKCNWRWLIQPVSAGWIPTPSLSSRDDADEHGYFNPGFRFRFTFPRD